MIDSQLPASWQGSYGTLNTRQALAEIHARLLQLEAPTAMGIEDRAPRGVVMLYRHDGRINAVHVTVSHQKVATADEAIAAMRKGKNWIFVQPTAASAVIDALEADVQQTTGSPAGV
jgi:hypothetical protein